MKLSSAPPILKHGGGGGGGVRESKIKSWILVDQSDIWIPKCTEGIPLTIFYTKEIYTTLYNHSRCKTQNIFNFQEMGYLRFLVLRTLTITRRFPKRASRIMSRNTAPWQILNKFLKNLTRNVGKDKQTEKKHEKKEG